MCCGVVSSIWRVYLGGVCCGVVSSIWRVYLGGVCCGIVSSIFVKSRQKSNLILSA